MDTLNLEKTMKKIVEIDSHAIELQKMYENLRMEYDKKLKREMHNLENEFLRSSKKKGKRYLKDMEHMLDDEEQRIRDISKQECDDLGALFFHNKSRLVDEVFEAIVLKEDD